MNKLVTAVIYSLAFMPSLVIIDTARAFYQASLNPSADVDYSMPVTLYGSLAFVAIGAIATARNSRKKRSKLEEM